MSSRTLCNIGTLLIGSLLCIVCPAQSFSNQAPANPILPNADPFITLHPVNGRYLLLATTGHNITIWSGKTIPTASSEAKVVFTPSDAMDQLWSPTLWQMAGHWWIYFTARQPSGEHAIYVLESDTSDPLGSYTFRGPLNLGRPAIDPSVLTLKGVNYLMYVTVDRGENAIQIVRLANPLQPSGPPSLIAEPEYPWEKGAGSSRTYPVDEGPTALYHDGKVFIVFSASDTASPLYCLGLLTFQGGDPLDRRNWKKSAQPVFSASVANNIFGPGRGTFGIAADGSEWLLYAAKSTDAPTAANRQTRAQHFTWNADGTPNFGTPIKDGPIAPAPALTQQSATPAAARLTYDVVTIKENKSQAYTTWLGYQEGDMLKMENANLITMLLAAFDLQDYLIEGVPPWGKSQHFDVQGKILDATPEQIKALTIEQRRAMLAAVLQQRFGLKTHWVTRDKPEYELIVAKNGSKLKESTELQTSSALNFDALDATRITTDDLTKGLAARLEKPVVNKTGLTGRYDIHLKWSVEGQSLNGAVVQDEGTVPSIFTAVKETLGLELKPTHGPAQVLVVDAAEPPTAN
jgi:uncharacterized protein (TIGR03435 family)